MHRREIVREWLEHRSTGVPQLCSADGRTLLWQGEPLAWWRGGASSRTIVVRVPMVDDTRNCMAARGLVVELASRRGLTVVERVA